MRNKKGVNRNPALYCCQSNRVMQPDWTVAEQFAEDMLQEIRRTRAQNLSPCRYGIQ